MILLEAGASTTIPCYSETHRVNTRKVPPIDYLCDGNPIDTLYLSIFEGQIMDDNTEDDPENSYIGQPFANLNWIRSQYNLVHAEDPS